MANPDGNNKDKRTEISAIGEFGLIERITKNAVLKNPGSVKGVGDDAAVIDVGNGNYKVISTDLMLEGIHFDLAYHPLRHLGYKAIISNLSDIYAMNGVPEQITVSIGISNRFSVESVEELYEGIHSACELYDVDLIGGDTSSSDKGLIISITVIGSVSKHNTVYRNSARQGDLIAVTGDLGAAFVGLQLLEREKQIHKENPDIQPDLEQEKYIVGRQLMPEARKDVIEIFDELKIIPTSMIDISDGLASDLLHICHQSGKGCRIYEEKIPIADETAQRAVNFNLSPISCALSGGEDYELLFTVDPSFKEQLDKYPQFSIIGYITKPSKGYKLAIRTGELLDLTSPGWDHFTP